MRTLYMTIGCLGSGKSTWAKKFIEDRPDTKIVSPDGFRSMFNGEYKYLAELDDIITQSCFDAARNLLDGGYDVIIDCGNITKAPDRRLKWKKLPANKFIAVVMPLREDKWHVDNRLRKPHWDEVDWYKIIQGEKRAYTPPTEDEFDEIWTVDEITKEDK